MAASAIQGRTLTSEVRAQVGLPKLDGRRYPWGRASFFSAIGVALLVMMHQPWLAWLVPLTTLVFLPLLRASEQRAGRARETIYREGVEVVGRVIEIEPPGDGRRDHIVRFEFVAGDRSITAAVVGPPIARRGLMPGDDITVVFDRTKPEACLVTGKVQRVSGDSTEVRAPNPPMIGDPVGCGGGGCGGGGCGGGCACKAGGCGSGGCG